MDISNSAAVGNKPPTRNEEKSKNQSAEVESQASRDAAVVQLSDGAKQSQEAAKSIENEKVVQKLSEESRRELATV